MRKRVLPALLALCMLVSLALPVNAYTLTGGDESCDHTFTTKVVKAPTCTATGLTKYTCTKCNGYYYDQTPAQHTPPEDGTNVAILAANCATDGSKTYVCTVCGKLATEILPATGEHQFEQDTIIPATCTTPELIGTACIVCFAPDPDADDVIELPGGDPALGHNEVKTVTKAPTCEDAGEATITCSRCDYEVTGVVVPAKGHTWDEGVLHEATCTEDEYVEYHCTVADCDGVLKEPTGLGKAPGHDFEGVEAKETVAPTCEEDGYVIKTCKRCHEDIKIVNEHSALDHDTKEVVVEPTCQTGGWTWDVCQRDGCDYKSEKRSETEADSTRHVPMDDPGGDSFVAATCTTAGTMPQKCELCGTALAETKPIPPKHTYTEEITTPARCGVAGEKTLTCSVCDAETTGHTTTEAIPPLEHDYSIEVEGSAVAGDCGHNGKEADMKCSLCGDVKTGETILATGEHVMEDQYIDATCTKNAKAGEVCTVCGYGEDDMEVIPETMLGHHYVVDTEASTPATCTEDGEEVSVCDRAGCTEDTTGHTKEEPIPAPGHDWDEANGELMSADCTHNEYELVHCKNCDATEERPLDPDAPRPLGHEYKKPGAITVVPPTCTEKGYTQYKCDNCGKIATNLNEDDDVPANDHTEDSEVVAPTCSAQGYTRYFCSVCGETTKDNDTFTDPVADNHKATDGKVMREPTCTTAGLVKQVCEYCGASLSYKSIEAGHKWNAGTVTTPATCTEKGEKTVTCTVCSATETQEIPDLGGHVEKDVIIKAATCKEDGEKKVVCETCGEVITASVKLPKEDVEHTWADEVDYREADCTHPMIVGYFCTVCGEVADGADEVGEALGHQGEENAVTTVPATCTEPGEAEYECTVCHETAIITIKAPGHDWDDEEGVYVDPTCEEGWKLVRTCQTCGATEVVEEQDDFTATTTHNWVAGTPFPATCTEDGYTPYTCSNEGCAATKKEIDEGTAHHTYGEWVEVVPPTCTEYGVSTRTCTVCEAGTPGYVETNEEVAKIPHDWEWVTDEEATCQEDGVKHEECSVCHAKQSENTAITHDEDDHDLEVGKVMKQATCTTNGLAKMVCKNCDYSEYQAIVAKHTWDDGVVTTPATCQAPGEKTVTCTVCGETDTEVIEQLEHSYTVPVAGTAIAPTCQPGRSADMKCATCDRVQEGEELDPVDEHDFQDFYDEGDCTHDEVAGVACTVCHEPQGELTVINEAPGHQCDNWDVTQEPTCTGTGLRSGHCSVCGKDIEDEVIPANGHTWDNVNGVLVEGDCETADTKVRTCTVEGCGVTETVWTDPTFDAATAKHQWPDPENPADAALIENHAATCWKGAYDVYTCSECLATKEVPTEGSAPTGIHNWVQDGEPVPPTCIAEGYTNYKCSVEGCDATSRNENDGDEVDKIDHDFEWVIDKPATCTEEGKKHEECSVCHAKQSENTAITELVQHDLVQDKVMKQPDCSATGLAKVHCKNCDYSGYVSLEKAHKYVANSREEIVEDSTCTEVGSKNVYCSVCDAEDSVKEVEIPMKAHTYVDVAGTAIVAKAPCGDSRTADKECSVCGDKVEGTDIPGTGEHDYDDLVLDATCTSPMLVGVACKNCGQPETEMEAVGDPIDHPYVKDEERSTEPDCENDGTDVFVCPVCGDETTETVLALEHDLDDGVPHDPDCEHGEYVLYTCQREGCDYTYVEETGLSEALGHDYDTNEPVVTEPTCTEGGYTTKTCARCGKTETSDETSALGHDMVATVVEPTCSAGGYTTHECSRCDYSEPNDNETEPDPNKHTPVVSKEMKPANCATTTNGLNKMECKDCHANLGYAPVDWEDAHVFDGREEIVDEADCENNGSKKVYCSVCGTKFDTVVIEATGHDYQVVPGTAKAATCGDGKEADQKCAICGDVLEGAVIPGTGRHEYEDEMIDATCESPMLVGEKCKVCGAINGGEMEEIGEALGHDWVEVPEESTAPTCTEDGKAAYKCSVCHKTKTEPAAPAGHTWDDGVPHDADCENGEYVLYTCVYCFETNVEETGLGEALGHDVEDVEEVTVASTCTEGGYKYQICKTCGKEVPVEDSETPALNHNYVLTEVTPATCKATGLKKSICNRCGAEEEGAEPEVIPVDANGHVPEIGKVMKAATCDKAGLNKMVCSLCDANLGYEQVAAHHTWDNGVVTTEPECGVPGEKTFHCTVCSDGVKTEPMDALEHEYSIVVPNTAKAATCGAKGQKADLECANCGEVKPGEEIPATGKHNFEEDTIVEATCTEPEKVGTVCTVCGMSRGELTPTGEPALGHDYEYETIEAPTCTEGGTRKVTCSRCDYEGEEPMEELGHDLDSGELHEADCEHGEYVLYTCQRADCDYEKIEETGLSEALGHDFKTLTPVVTDPTCTEGGYTTKKCSRCDATEQTDKTDPLGHAMVDTVVPGTCAAGGYTTHRCSRCGESTPDTDPTPMDANNHVWDHSKDKVMKAATCTAKGLVKLTCGNCGATKYDQTDMAEHEWDNGVVQSAATCTAGAVTLYTCANCQTTKTVTGDPIAHSFGDEQLADDYAYLYKVCGVCGCVEITDYVMVPENETCKTNGHVESAQPTDTLDATATEPGYDRWTCTVCGVITKEIVKPATMPPHTHVWASAWSSDGAKHWHACTVDGCTAKNDEADHAAEADAAVPATCTDTGLTAGSHCSVCAKVLVAQAVTDALNHAAKTHVARVEATEEEDGNIEYWYCSACDKYFSDAACATEIAQADTVIPALAHEHTTQLHAAVAATCTEAGNSAYYECTKCHKLFSDAAGNTEITAESVVINALGHTEVIDPAAEATCTTAGKTEGKHCSVCGTVIVAQTDVPATGHTEVSANNGRDATCTAAGKEADTICSVCGDTITTGAVIPALNHANKEAHAAVAATEEHDGNEAYWYCSDCQKYFLDADCTNETTLADVTLPMINHQHTTQRVAAKDATCTEAGNRAYYECTKCHKLFSDAQGNTEITAASVVIAALGHTEVIDPAVEATCTTAGKTEGKHCSVCQTVIVAQTDVPVKAHTEVIDPAIEATCTATGLTEGKHCSVCGTVLVAPAVVPVKAHTEVIDPAVEATCTATGLTEGKHCSVCGTVIVAQTVVAAKGHTEVSANNGVAATCTEAGKQADTVCSVCGVTTKTGASIAALGHDYDEDGICTRCGEERPANQCDHANATTKYKYDKATKTYYKEYTCPDCGEVWRED